MRTFVAVPVAVCLMMLISASQSPAGNADLPSATSEHRATFAALDANHDGEITADEFPAEQKRLLVRLVRIADKNGDGKLNEAEFLDGLKETASKHPLEEKEDNESPLSNPDTAMERFDKNKDGKLAREEFPEQLRNRLDGLFKRGDKDGDGLISKAELADYQKRLRDQEEGKDAGIPGPGMEQMFKMLDTNGDGKITRDEIPADKRPRIAQMFDRLDANHDGSLSEDELIAGLKKLMPSGQSRSRRPGAEPLASKASAKPIETTLGNSQGMAGDEKSMAMSDESGTKTPAPASKKEETKQDSAKLPKRFEAMDADHDGRISKAEFKGGNTQRFDRLDANHDGYLDAEELRAGRPNP